MTLVRVLNPEWEASQYEEVITFNENATEYEKAAIQAGGPDRFRTPDFTQRIPKWIVVKFPTCSTCKHWDTTANPLPWNGRKPCRAPDEDTENGMCADGGDGSDGIYTGPDFGCIHHEPKES